MHFNLSKATQSICHRAKEISETLQLFARKWVSVMHVKIKFKLFRKIVTGYMTNAQKYFI